MESNVPRQVKLIIVLPVLCALASACSYRSERVQQVPATTQRTTTVVSDPAVVPPASSTTVTTTR